MLLCKHQQTEGKNAISVNKNEEIFYLQVVNEKNARKRERYKDIESEKESKNVNQYPDFSRISAVYFDQRTGAPHAVCWSK